MPAGALVPAIILLLATTAVIVVVVRVRLTARVWRSEWLPHEGAMTWAGGCQVRESGGLPGLGSRWLLGRAVITHGRIHLTPHRWALRSRKRPAVVIGIAVLDRPGGLPPDWSWGGELGAARRVVRLTTTTGARLELALPTDEVERALEALLGRTGAAPVREVDGIPELARSLLGLLAAEDYEAVEALTSARHLSAADLEDAVREFELVVAPTPADRLDTIAYDEARHSYRLTETSADVRRAYCLTAEVWTADGELSGLTLEVTVWVDEDGVLDVELDNLHPL